MSRRPLPSTRRRASLGTALIALCLIVLTEPSLAFRPDAESISHEILPSLESTLYDHTPERIAADAAAIAYSRTLAEELGAGWSINSWHQFAGSARSVTGPGIVVAPGGLAAANANTAETLSRQFIAAHPDLFRTDGSDLVLTRARHGAGRWGVLFHQVVDGIRVQDSQVVIALHDNGRLFAFGASIYTDIQVPLTPTIEPTVAASIARASVPYDPSLELRPGSDALVILPIHAAPGQVDFRLAHRTDVPTSNPTGMYRTWIDAHSGDVLLRDNRVEQLYEGSVTGDVEILSYCDGDTPDTPFEHMWVAIDGVGSDTTDEDGDFTVDGDLGPRTFTAQFDGPSFNVECSGCTDAEITGTITPGAPESIVFDAGGFRADERDVFYFANLTKDYVLGIDPDFFVFKYTANVNINATCNANWGGTTMNFFQEGNGCANTGRLGDVVAHEFGHGVQDWATGGGQGPQGLGEGNADVLATFITDNPQIGIGFNLDDCKGGLGGRNCDNTLFYPDDLGGGVHSDGRIICGFNWDVRRNLEPSMGFEGAKAYTANLWHFARALYMDSSNIQPDQAERYFWVADDDGNLENGTPNHTEICGAAEIHGYLCTPAPTRILITHSPLGDTLGLGPYTVAAEVITYIEGVPTEADGFTSSGTPPTVARSPRLP